MFYPHKKKKIQVPKAFFLWNLNDQRLTMMLKQPHTMLNCQKDSRCSSSVLHSGKIKASPWISPHIQS